MEAENLLQVFQKSLFSDLPDPESFPAVRPLIAHYTSLECFEQMLRTQEVWFSNPLFMNDLQEVRFGIEEAMHMFHDGAVLEACGTEERFLKLSESLDHVYRAFADDEVLDTYIFCTSRHAPGKHDDGLLSMWRGYGGNGKGVAVVFDTKVLGDVPESPLIISRVVYASTEDRKGWLRELIAKFAVLIAQEKPPTDLMYLCAHVLFQRIKLFALFTKHDGFTEEEEWRVAYIRDRDTTASLHRMFSYSVGKQGVVPRLKLKIMPIPGATGPDFSLSKVIHKIILGPGISGPLNRAVVARMLQHRGFPELKERLSGSTIPFDCA